MPTSSSSALLSSKFHKRAKNNNNSSAEEPKNPVDQSAPSKTQEASFKMRPQEGSKTSGDAPARLSNGHARKKAVRYRECRKNHAANIGGYAVDGCREFMASGEEGSSGALKCAACSCHRNFHKREVENECLCDCSSNSTNRK